MKTYEERILDIYYKNDPISMKKAIERLKNNEPLAYIVGECAFYGEMYTVTPDTLIPRPDTEHLVEHIIKRLPAGGCFADLCTGSGAVGISVLAHSGAEKALLVDISEGAIEVAEKNAKRNGVLDRCKFLCEDLNNLHLDQESFDIIASNPPYVRTDVVPTLEKECSYEPYIAFDGGEDGMYFYRLILEKFRKALKRDGYFIFEIGYDQGEAINTLAESFGFKAEVFKDYGKNDRVAVISNSPSAE